MFKKYLQLVIFCLTLSLNGQVGIGISNPQKELHIANPSSSIRIDGLNSSNQANNYGIRPAAVHSNNEGDVILPSSPTNSQILFNGKDIFTNAVQVRSGLRGEANTTQIFQTAPFTLTKTAVVLIQYSINFTITDFFGSFPVDDGKPRLVSNYIRLGNGSTTTSTTKYAITGSSYTNNISNNGNSILIGALTNNATDALVLPPGTYSFHLYSHIINNGGTNERLSDSYAVNFGGFNSEYIKITAFF